MPLKMSRLTREYVFVPIQSPNDLTSTTAELAFMSQPGELPEESDWNSVALQAAGQNWEARVLVGPDGDVILPVPTDYQVWLRLTDEVERPVRRAGIITIE